MMDLNCSCESGREPTSRSGRQDLLQTAIFHQAQLNNMHTMRISEHASRFMVQGSQSHMRRALCCNTSRTSLRGWHSGIKLPDRPDAWCLISMIPKGRCPTYIIQTQWATKSWYCIRARKQGFRQQRCMRLHLPLGPTLLTRIPVCLWWRRAPAPSAQQYYS